jgi:outer membrane receptor for ferrienterochelin and colicin
MRRTGIGILLIALVALAAAPVVAQTGHSSLRGRVEGPEGAGLPGVTVTIESPSLPGGTQTKVTQANGDYLFQALPAGDYIATFSLAGHQTVRAELKLLAAQPHRYDITLTEEMTEEVTVTSSTETVSQGSQVASTFEKDVVEKLPVPRTINGAVALAPGVFQTGPAGNTVINGAQSYQNLYLVNGVVVNENLRGQPFDLFIEDAIEETTVQTGNISAEYGRFSGGVVNTITRSGGNEFSASLRINLDNEDWVATAPGETGKADEINEVYEGTFGGRIIRDRLWFFLAARDRTDSTEGQTRYTDVAYPRENEETRLEGKLTFAPSANHRFVGSYFEIDETQTNYNFRGWGVDFGWIDESRSLPLEGLSFNYTGIITPNFFIDGLYSEREFTFASSGGNSRDLVEGTWILDYYHMAAMHSPVFCGVCPDEERDNENARLKASYFLATDTFGSHEFVAGADTFNDIRLSDNHQSGSDWTIWITDTLDADGDGIGDPGFNPDGTNIFPYIPGGNSFASEFWWYPIVSTSKGTDFTTNSFFVNDEWRFNDRWSFNIGVRYDENDGQDAEGKTVIDDSRFSPRIGASYDLGGEGIWQLTAGYGHYVSAIANTVADASSTAGTPASIGWFYRGPDINVGDPPYSTPRESVTMMMDWLNNFFEETYGAGVTATSPDLLDVILANLTTIPEEDRPYYIDIPGTSTVIGDDLASPYGEELTFGVSRRLGSRGIVRADYVWRDYHDFYSTFTTLETGKTTEGADRSVIRNEDDFFERTYHGLSTQVAYRLSDKLALGGNWTWSHTYGNVVGETAGSGPVTVTFFQYPEYKEASWNYPTGDLATDQRHKIRAWATYDIFTTDRQSLSVSVLQNFWSGTPYSASGEIHLGELDPSTGAFVPYLANPGYTSPPRKADYYFSPRGEFTTEDITRTDLTFNYSFFIRDIELFLQPELLNVWNEDGVVAVNTTMLTAVNAGFDRFNPYTEEPVQGVHWDYGSDFGQPQRPEDYQMPRTFQVSLGVRF